MARDLAFMLAFGVTGAGWWWLYRRYRLPEAVVLAAVVVLERIVSGPTPEPGPTSGRYVASLTVKDTRWGRANYPATHPVYEWVVTP
jgi:hypothetical protein